MNENRGNQSNDASLDKNMQEIYSLMNSYEQLVAEIQLEAKNFQEENRQLRENLAAIIEENNRLRAKNGNVVEDLVGTFRRDYIDMAEKIFRNLREQFSLCQREKEMFEALYTRTAKVLEREVPLNSIAKLQTDHSLEMKRLKEEFLSSQFECEKQTKMNKLYQINMREMLKKLESVQANNKALNDANNELNEKIKQQEKERDEIEQFLEESNELNKEQMRKSTESFQRMQESIAVADGAMAEVQQLMHEKNLIQDEYENLARTIGSVIEEAAERVDKDIEELKMKHQHEMASAKIEIEHLNQTIEYEREKTKSAMQQSKALEEKFNSQGTKHSLLNQDLELALKILTDTEGKLAIMKSAISEERESNKLCQNEVDNLKLIIENHKRTKEKWKEAIFEMTKTLEEKVIALIEENHKLKSRRSL